MDITLGQRDDNTGRFNFVIDPITRDVSFDDTEAHAVMTSAAEDLGSYWADETHGSELSQISNITAATASQAEAAVLAAELQLEQQNKIANVVATASTGNHNGLGVLGVDLSWTVPGNTTPQTGTV